MSEEAEPAPVMGRPKKNLNLPGGNMAIMRVVRAPDESAPPDELSPDEIELSAPAGSLVPIPGCPNFRDSHEAKKWLKAQSHAFDLDGKKVAIIEFKALFVITSEPIVRSKTTLTMDG